MSLAEVSYSDRDELVFQSNPDAYGEKMAINFTWCHDQGVWIGPVDNHVVIDFDQVEVLIQYLKRVLKMQRRLDSMEVVV